MAETNGNGEHRKFGPQLPLGDILKIIVYLVVIVVAYAQLRDQAEATARRQEQMEHDFIRRDQYDEFQQDISRRLTRIEDKIDEEKKLRALDQQYNGRH